MLVGMATEVSEEQLSKQYDGILVIPEGREALFRDPQPLKAEPPSVVTPSGIEICLSEEQREKAYDLIVVIVEGRSIEVSELQLWKE